MYISKEDKPDDNSMGLQEQLYRRWVLSEQQEGGVKVYQKTDNSNHGNVEDGFLVVLSPMENLSSMVNLFRAHR